MRERVSLVIRALESAERVSELCREFGVSRKTAYKWIRIYLEEGGFSALADRSRRPHHSPLRTAEAQEQEVLATWSAHGWAGRKISHELGKRGIRISPSTVDRILRRHGRSQPRGPGQPTLRFEREAANDLWQMDHKATYELADGPCVPLSVLDDHSRFALGLVALRSTGHESTAPAFRQCLETYGLPRQVLVDHGVPWWSSTNGHGLTRFAVELIEQGIELLYSGIAHPQTQGKVERFHLTLDRALRHWGLPRARHDFQEVLTRFRHEYNEVRPHEALGMDTPRARYQPSPRPYRPQPPPWEYPTGAEVRTVNGKGLLDLPGGERYFVCHALAGRRVWCRRLGSTLLVVYRHMLIREIDRNSGRTRAVIQPAKDLPS